ncbi:MAG: PQQ-dependent sugar dehydrogenase [Planctomycetota bacterium]
MLRLAVLLLLILTTTGLGQESKKWDRIPWTTSQFKGTPEPPLPFLLERVYEEITLVNPTDMIRVPGTDRWIVIQMSGTVVSFNDQAPYDLKTSIELDPCFRGLSIIFDPEYPKVPYCYIQYSYEKKNPEGTRLSRFRVTETSTPVIDPQSEEILMRWESTDHMGGSLHFGPDGYLYFSIGDGQRPNPPDPAGTGQDISDIQSSIIRIDVHDKQDGLPYRIPKDNPFVNVPGARGEVWAFGVRNPWKMSFRPRTDELWAGDVGWEMIEMIHVIEKGANYGWSVVEGSQVVKKNGVRYPVPITPPIYEYDHTVGRSITGGYFWESPRIPELKDAYIYGDFVTGKVWALRHDGQKLVWQKELANSPYQVICFARGREGEILTVMFGKDGIYRLTPNPKANSESAANFPQRLSETGLFSSTVGQEPAPGVIPYSINSHHWSDHTESKQWFALPGHEKLGIYKREKYDHGEVKGLFDFPKGTVFAKTVTYRSDVGDPESEKRLETQILHRLDKDWRAYNYIWNEDQTDAILQENEAIYRDLEIKDPDSPDGIRHQKWLHASRDQCMMCHIWRSGSINGFKPAQVNRRHEGESINQLAKFEKMSLTKLELPRRKPAVSKNDLNGTLEERALRYLDQNCGHCHRPGGGGSAAFNLLASVTDPDQRNLFIDASQGDFGIENAKVVDPGHPEKSVLLYRIAKNGSGRMPKFGNDLIDQEGIQLIRDWIASLDPVDNVGDDSNEMGKFLKQLDSWSGDPQTIQEPVHRWTSSIESSLLFSIELGRADISPQTRMMVARHLKDDSRSQVRELFERFLPAKERAQRLGPDINTDQLLAVRGSFERGEKLFFESSLTCRNCHQVEGQGRMVGPDLTMLGNQRNRAHILESILDPSKIIEDKYRGIVVLTIDGEIVSGLKGKETDDELTIIPADGKSKTVLKDDIEEIRELDKSLMPERLLEELTEQEAADLLAYLASLGAKTVQ